MNGLDVIKAFEERMADENVLETMPQKPEFPELDYDKVIEEFELAERRTLMALASFKDALRECFKQAARYNKA